MTNTLDLDALTRRERAVVELLAQGYGTKEIAARLGRAAPTISTQKKSALRKLKVSSAVELALQINGVTMRNSE
ncbi:helix-turn-helix transcriptional regulator [Stenotrophomonas sp. 169]|uniref:helix-turn-helix domain-containing protein n=1 Tax=Stenotrophomonas sp. 169 TaxID=2770322 RepID=UPI0016623D5C|nr:helix-turn-helix transcriptional regulator [Stenotrophomonas sp. 169]QNR97501.1 helix-turn-helix transcriptional regulator [Stenotrophomonas sp. 169]